MDTLNQARYEREMQGPWEIEVSYGGEADLHMHFKKCLKNPTHQNFLPVDSFKQEHLPDKCRDSDLVDCIKTLSDLTARVSVKHVSDKRPETFPDTKIPYPCYKKRGQNLQRYGTGWVYAVDVYLPGDEYNKYLEDNLNRKPEMTNVVVSSVFPDADGGDSSDDGDGSDGGAVTCECKECLASLTPKTRFARFRIYTAAHVIFDNEEAKQATCHLFFDRDDRPDACSGVVTLSGMSCGWNDTKSDRSDLNFYTHDMELADRLHKLVSHWRDLQEILREKYPTPWTDREATPREAFAAPDKDSVTVIVSHPHGCSKQITIGRCDTRGHLWDGWTVYKYSTATCHGSSGARVLIIGGSWRWWDNHVHAGNCMDNKELNYSAHGFD